METNLQERVARILSELDDTIPVIGQKLGVNKNTIATYKKCKGDLKGVVIENLVAKYGINPIWLLTGDGPTYKDKASESEKAPNFDDNPAHHVIESHPKHLTNDGDHISIPQWDDPDPGKYHYVPMAEATLNAGGGSFVISERTTGKYYAFRANFLAAMSSGLKNLVLMKVTGDSMEPKIEDGDTVMIDVGRRRVISGAIYALGFDDTILLKEIEIRPGGKVMVISRNRRLYPPYEMEAKDIRIIGQVIWGDRTFVK